MSSIMTYRSDMLIHLLRTLDRRTQVDEDTMFQDENTIRDVFFPLLENFTYAETVELLVFSGMPIWGDGVMETNWRWDMGGVWS